MAEPRKVTLTIPSAGTLSGELALEDQATKRPYTLTIWSPTTLPEVVTVQAAPDNLATSTFQALQSGGADITLPAAKATVITILAAGKLRLSAAVAVAADRVFEVRAAAVA